MNNRAYKMKKRAEQMAETRLRITEAAMKLHTTIGPARTTISAVAEEADVTRVTVYRHFPDEESLFLACSAHWIELHPAPNPEEWTQIETLEERSRTALADLYEWYRENHTDFYPIMRDFEAIPPAFREKMTHELTSYADALVQGSRLRGKRRHLLRAVAGHFTSFSTWWSLAIEQDVNDDEAVELAVGFIASI